MATILNKKARYEYEILDRYTAGIVLTGSEIKSFRAARVSLIDSYCTFIKGELFVKNLHIAEYTWANQFNHETRRMRKLLLQKRELQKLESKVKEKGFTIVPLKMFLSERGFAKLEIGLVRGKKIHDKRASIKERDVKRDLSRERY
jgi:SsrA-binding protein